MGYHTSVGTASFKLKENKFSFEGLRMEKTLADARAGADGVADARAGFGIDAVSQLRFPRLLSGSVPGKIHTVNQPELFAFWQFVLESRGFHRLLYVVDSGLCCRRDAWLSCRTLPTPTFASLLQLSSSTVTWSV